MKSARSQLALVAFVSLVALFVFYSNANAAGYALIEQGVSGLGNDWVGRYHAIKSAMLTININPSIAYKVTDQLSLGAGISIQYIKAELTNAIDFGTMDALGIFRPISMGLAPQMADGFAQLKGDSWAVGFNLGALYEFTKNTRMGITYRSKIKQKLTGNAEFTGVPSALGPLPVFKNGWIKADVTLPDSASASIYHNINDHSGLS